MTQAITPTHPNAAGNAAGNLAAHAYLASLKSDVGRAGMASALRKVARAMGAADIDQVNWATLNPANVRAIVTALSEQRIETGKRKGNKVAPATVVLALNAIKGVARACWETGGISTEMYERIRSVKAPKGSRLPAGRDVDAGERKSLIQTCAGDTTAAGARDTALLCVAIATGMRRAELVALKLRDVDIETGKLTVRGKGDKERTCYVRAGAQRALRDWLAVRGHAAGALFPVIAKGGAIFVERHMSTTAAHYILQRRTKDAGVREVAWHDLRRTFAGELLDAGQDISTVAAMMGHASVQTTAKYDRRGERAKENAAAFISVPYYGRTSVQSV